MAPYDDEFEGEPEEEVEEDIEVCEPEEEPEPEVFHGATEQNVLQIERLSQIMDGVKILLDGDEDAWEKAVEVERKRKHKGAEEARKYFLENRESINGEDTGNDMNVPIDMDADDSPLVITTPSKNITSSDKFLDRLPKGAQAPKNALTLRRALWHLTEEEMEERVVRAERREPLKVRKYFNAFYMLGEDRTYDLLVEKFSINPKVVRLWARKYLWNERIRMKERKQMEGSMLQSEQETIQMQRNILDANKKMIENLLERDPKTGEVLSIKGIKINNIGDVEAILDLSNRILNPEESGGSGGKTKGRKGFGDGSVGIQVIINKD